MRTFLGLGTGLLVAVVAASGVRAEGKIQVDVNSAYVWRGITVNEDPVAQPYLEATLASGLVVSVWANYDLGDYNGAFEENEFSEIDLGACYTREVGPVELALGYTEYLYPHQADETNALAGSREVYLTAGMELTDGLSVSAGFYYDVDEVEDFYASLGLTYGYDLVEDTLSAELGALVGYVGEDWATAYSGGTDGGWNEYTLSLGLSYTAIENVEIGLRLAFSDTLDTDVLPNQDVDFLGGISIAYGF